MQTYEQFLGVRALFRITMGGIYGNCAATALDVCPVAAGEFISVLLQAGYAVGLLLCVAFNRAIVPNSEHRWRALFWFGACPVLLPETDAYPAQKAIERDSIDKTFITQAKESFKIYWLMFIYMVTFIAGFNFMSHGSQDLFPTFLIAQLRFSSNASTVTNSIANLGFVIGTLCMRYLSEVLGRRLTMLLSCVVGGVLIYPWAFVSNGGLVSYPFTYPIVSSRV